MKDITALIRAGYKTKLAGISVSVFDEIKPTANTDAAYVLLSTQAENMSRTKEAFIHDAQMVVNVIVRSIQVTGKKACDDIAAEVIEAICPINEAAGYISLGSDFQVKQTRVLQNETLHNMTGTEHVYRRIIRFEHSVLEK